MSKNEFETISSADLDLVSGGGDLWDATRGAVRIRFNPVRSAVNAYQGYRAARKNGYSVSESAANGLVRAAGTMNAPDLGNIPSR